MGRIIATEPKIQRLQPEIYSLKAAVLTTLFFERKKRGIVKTFTSAFIMIFALLGSTASTAEELSMKKVFSLSLEELGQLEVVVASKSPEKIANAPGSVTSYSHRDLDRLGYYNLADLANITPGYSSCKRYGESTFETRGQKASSFDNNRHLLLIDGIPANHLRAYMVPADNNLPLFFADRIEFLRGPGSALYGVSAFYGVINILPIELTDPETRLDGRFSVGTYDHEQQVMINALHATDAGHGGIRIGLYKKEASKDYVGHAKDPDHRNYDDQDSTFLYGTWEFQEGPLNGLKLGGLYTCKEGSFGDRPGSYSTEKNTITWESMLLYTKYNRELTDTLSINGYLKYNHASNKATYYANETTNSIYNYPFHSIEGMAEINLDISTHQSLIVGINHDSRYGPFSDTLVKNVPSHTHRTPTVNTTSAFVQYKTRFPIFQGMLITAGAREDYGSAGPESYSQLSPRIAVVEKFTDNFNLKLMYGEALRGPSLMELGINDEIRTENPGLSITPLQPEEIRTFEIAPYFHTDRWISSLTFFHNETQNYLNRNWANTNVYEYINLDGVSKSYGVELEVNYITSAGTKIFANYSYAKSKDTNGKELMDIPDQKANLGFMWDNLWHLPVKGSVVGRWLNEYTVPDSSQSPVAGHCVVDVNLGYSLSEYIELQLQIRNLFDNEYYHPGNGVDRVAMPGTTGMLSLVLKN